VDTRLVVCVLGLVLVVVQCAVMVFVPVGDGCLVEGGLIQGGVCSPEPSQRRNGLRDDNAQRQQVRGHDSQWSGIEQGVYVERRS
jgi:hypothetical protein